MGGEGIEKNKPWERCLEGEGEVIPLSSDERRYSPGVWGGGGKWKWLLGEKKRGVLPERGGEPRENSPTAYVE